MSSGVTVTPGPNVLTKCWMSSGMSVPRSRSGGTLTRITARR